MADAARRSTRQRAAIAELLRDAESFLTAQEIHERLRGAGAKVGLTTVYRTLQLLAETGDVDVLHAAGTEAVYRSCEASQHHHHLVCRHCRRSVEVESDELEAWAHNVATRHGFRAPSHTLEIFGICADCADPA